MTGWKAQWPEAELDDESFELVAATRGSGAPRARATQRKTEIAQILRAVIEALFRHHESPWMERRVVNSRMSG